MKWFLNRCQRNRESLCLLASGLLQKQELAEIENHLAECAGCRKHYEELKAAAAPLANWDKHFTHIAPDPAAQLRWEKAVKAAGNSESIQPLTPKIVLFECWRQLIWPSRRIWAGLAATWLLILIANLNLKSGAPRMMATTSPRSADFIMAMREQAQMVAEMTGRAESKIAEPPKPFVPRPRSEHRQEFFTI